MKINLDEKEIYYTGDLNRQQFEVLLDWLKKNDTGWEATNIEDIQNLNGCDSLKYSDDSWGWELNEKQTKNAKELFYTLENIQVDCRELSEEQIKQMADVYASNGFEIGSLNLVDGYFFIRNNFAKYCLVAPKDYTKTTITYDKFIELFGDTLVEDVIETTDEVSPSNLSSIFNARGKEDKKENLKKTLKYLLKKDIILTPKQYKKLWKKS